MLKYLLPATLAAALAGPLAADEIDHYAAEPSETFAEAVANFNDYNARVSAILEKDDLTVADMEEIHQYTYTLEIALAKINETLTELPATLEEVHLASEDGDPAVLRDLADTYLQTAMELR
ncbi:DUF6746 family protein [Histidinibacterium lentulum]|uniref:Uncharacterized protein n=1 Tax=Histidinibacterium lentulum TaxID=2480588 RepID=A0A3N2R0U6_9RHOB|nr:DUF6746 family protein [Histidinibacterium lentulum]ROU01101.1 hypothetical protein EAT49_11285 [Histidinibacterium lentulum]